MADEQPDATQQPAPVAAPDPAAPAPVAADTTPPEGDPVPQPVGNAGAVAAVDPTAGAAPAVPATDPQPAAPAPVPSPDDLTSNFKKDELATAAAVVGADVSSSATKQDIAEAIVAQTQPAPVARAVIVDNFTRRNDDDAILGSFVDVVDGPYKGRYAAYLDDLTNNPETGYPQKVLLRTRDADHMLIDVNYSDIRPTARTR